ncbi:MAG: hypothetical protein JXQ71_10360 [Verrucomicrobia bacterium]|nr:hypothetical protein [Verrucomicrobiota bacterium]
MSLSTLAVLLGVGVAALNGWGLWKPASFARAARGFPRSVPVGVALMVVATLWFLHYLGQEEVSDFTSFKPGLYALFAGVGLGACLFVQDFLPVRALAVLMLLMGKHMVDTARWEDTAWRLVIVTWAYVWVLAGMWLTISPWRYRDFLEWNVASGARLRMLCGVRVAFGIGVVVLGLTAYRAGELPHADMPGVSSGDSVAAPVQVDV